MQVAAVVWTAGVVLTHPAVGEGHNNPPSVTLCEEIGQVYYSTSQEVVPQESNNIYSRIHHDTITERGVSREDGVADSEDMRMGVYSVLSYGDKPQPQRHAEAYLDSHANLC